MLPGVLNKSDDNQENGSNSSPGHFFINPANSFKKDGDQSNSNLSESAVITNILLIIVALIYFIIFLFYCFQ